VTAGDPSFLSFIFGGGLVMLGGGARWMWEQIGKREAAKAEQISKLEATKAARIDAEASALELAKAEHMQALKQEMADLHKQVNKLGEAVHQLREQNYSFRIAFEIVSSVVRRSDPRNSDLLRAERILQRAFSVEDVPLEFADIMAALHDIPARGDPVSGGEADGALDPKNGGK
jgi:hypothetical protein